MSERFDRWWIAPPQRDEALGSVVERAARFYECESACLWEKIHWDRQAEEDSDNPGCTTLYRLARCLGVRPASLCAHRIEDAPWHLHHRSRQAVCPTCWKESETAIGAGVRVRSWSEALVTTCSTHRAPLVQVRPGAVHWHPPAALEDPRDVAVLQLVEMFGRALCDALFRGCAWPVTWRGDAILARDVLSAAVSTGDPAAGFPQVNSICTTPALGAYIHGFAHHWAAPADVSGWQSFRRVGDPAIRRAAIWIVAWQFIPDLPEALCPGWIDRSPSAREIAKHLHGREA